MSGAVVLVLVLAEPPASANPPGTMTVTSDTTLTEDHYGSIEIAADEVTLDCAGFSLIGPSPDDWPVDGVLVDQHSGVTIKNCVARGFVNGFKLQGVTGSTLVGNTATANEGNGFYAADGSEANTFRDNVSFDNVVGHGFTFEIGADDNLLRANIAYGNGGNGVQVYRGRGNELRGNVVHDNEASGFYLESSSANSLVANVARRNGTGLNMHQSSGNVFKTNRFINNGPEGWGVWVARSSDNNLFVNNVSRGNGYEGFAIAFGSSGNRLVRNVSRTSDYEGISLYFGADSNVVRANVTTRNASSGILIYQSSHNLITKNRSFLNNWGQHDNSAGISLIEGSSFNDVVKNVACRNGDVDAYDDHSGTANTWEANEFCTSDI